MKKFLSIISFLVSLHTYGQVCDSGILDPDVKSNLQKLGDLQPRLNRVSIEQAKQDRLHNEELYPDGDVSVFRITSDSIPVYIFNATHGLNLPVILYFHPGGFVTPFLPFMKYDCWKMSKDLQAIVFAVDYRIAPEFKFPAAVNDAYRSFEWVLHNAKRYGGNIDKLSVAGHSAGANLAAVLSIKARDNGLGSKIKLQILNCPSVDNMDHQWKYPSYRKYASGYFQTREFIVFAQKEYCDSTHFDNPEFAPILTPDFFNLPPAVIIKAEFDILRDEDAAYADSLRKANVKVWEHCFHGQIHCLVGLPPESPAFETLNEIIRNAMREVFDL